MLNRPLEIKENIILGPLTFYRIGGPARFYSRPTNRESLQEVLRWAHQEDLPTFVLGAGSNVLVSDRGCPGLIVHLLGFQNHHQVVSSDGSWEVGAGAKLIHWVRRTVTQGYAGAEALIGIPGTIGGALRMNAGAFTVEIGALAKEVEIIALDPNGGTGNPDIQRISPEAISFAYREAPGLNNTVILSARFQLTPGDPQKLLNRVREIVALRHNRQPLSWPSCGSVFKRPANDYAGRLIEASGLKGLTIGQARVSPKHANFIVNLGGATAADVLALIKSIKQRVEQDAGITLQREVILIGFDDHEMEGT